MSKRHNETRLRIELQHAHNPSNRWWKISQKATHSSNNEKINFLARAKSTLFIPISSQKNYKKKIVLNPVIFCSFVFVSHNIILYK